MKLFIHDVISKYSLKDDDGNEWIVESINFTDNSEFATINLYCRKTEETKYLTWYYLTETLINTLSLNFEVEGYQ
jgi:lysyl-tRNA synthetase class II